MNRLKSRITKLEKNISGPGNMPITMKVAYIGDNKGDSRIKKIKNEYFEEHGTMDGLVVVHSLVPEPLPLPEAFK